MITFEEFANAFSEIQDGVLRDYTEEDGTKSPLCHIMHRDIGLEETPHEAAAEVAEALRKAGQLGHTESSLDLTEEHAQLHGFLHTVRMQAAVKDVSTEQLIMAMFVIGRRYGMREAAEMFSAGFDADDVNEGAK